METWKYRTYTKEFKIELDIRLFGDQAISHRRETTKGRTERAEIDDL
jgi:hypothetical protein